MRRKLLGDAYIERINQTAYADPHMKKFLDVATENVFGALWTRPGLDIKTRALNSVVSDAATARTPELALHIRMARRQGWTEDELREVRLRRSVYVGVPLVREAMLHAKDVFAEMRQERWARRRSGQEAPVRERDDQGQGELEQVQRRDCRHHCVPPPSHRVSGSLSVSATAPGLAMRLQAMYPPRVLRSARGRTARKRSAIESLRAYRAAGAGGARS